MIHIHPSFPYDLTRDLEELGLLCEHCTYVCLGSCAEEVSHRQEWLVKDGWHQDDGWDFYSDDNTVDQQHDNSMMTST